jgi:hypothetical protein
MGAQLVFQPGDRLAGYGLTALVGGGAVAVAAKTGLLQKFGKFLVFLVVGALAGLKKLLSAFRAQRQPVHAPAGISSRQGH